MNRLIIFLFFLIVVGCQSNLTSKDNLIFKGTYWVSETLDPYIIDYTTGEKTIYGSGYLLFLDTNENSKLLSGDFYWKLDTLCKGGEPGITLKQGEWNVNENLILKQKLIYRTILSSVDPIGKIEIDTIEKTNDTVIFYRNQKLIPVRKISTELKYFMNNDWTLFER